MIELQCSVRKHSRKQLEMKIVYPLKDKRKLSYAMDCYFFFPSRLHMTEKRIGVSGFLNNMQINTRFSSPLLPLDKVIDGDFQLSPLIRIESLLDSIGREKRGFGKTMLYELQTLCNIYRAETRNFVALIKKEVRKDRLDGIYRERILQMMVIIRAFLKRFRQLHIGFLDPHVDEKLRTALRWADESVSIITEKGLIKLHGYCGGDDDCETRTIIEEMIEGETKYRSSMKYTYLYDEKDLHCGETMAYRESTLKKWSQSAMYMNSQYSSAPGRIGHLIAGSAAGLAMFFAVFAAIFAENIFPRNSSLWILIMVISYIMKDRIKEVLRSLFGNLMPGLTTDQKINLYDPAMKTKVGKSSGILRYKTPSAIPDHIKELRDTLPNPFRKVFPPDHILHYRKTVKVKSAQLITHHKRLDSLTEIIRFQVDQWLKEMDDPLETLYRLEKGKREMIQGNRVYRVHMIINLEGLLRHYVLILNKSGILRIEKSR